MRTFFCLLLTLWGVGLAGLLVMPTRADEKTDAAQVAKLIAQLGSSAFAEREKASQELDKIGSPALEALQKATRSDDPEIRRRAEDLVNKIEKRTQSEKILKPTRVHLVYQDTPVKEAVEDFARKTKFNIVLLDPQNQLANRKITLDTGDKSFWEAFDLFCQKAGLVVSDGTQVIVAPPVQPGQPLPQPVPLPIQPRPPIRRGPVIVPQPQPQPVDPSEAQDGGAAQDQPAPAPVPVPVPPVIPANPPQPVPVPPVQAPAIAPAAMVARPIFRQPLMNNGQIMLMDGKPESLPTCYAGSVRIRALKPNAGTGLMLVNLEVLPEPTMQWQNLVNVKIDKAVDDQDQNLTQVAVGTLPANPNAPVIIQPNPGVPGVAQPAIVARRPLPILMGNQQQVPVQLKEGLKKSTSLKELTGSVSAQVRTGPDPIITVDNIIKAVGQTIQGKDGGSIKVVEAAKDNATGQFKIRIEMVAPTNVQPAGGQFGGAGVGFVQPALIIQPAPNQIQPVQPFPGQAPLQAQPQIMIAPGAMPMVGGVIAGLSLVDAKGQAVSWSVTPAPARIANNVVVQDITLITLPQGNQGEPAKLTFSGTRVVTVDIPLTLKDVPF